MADVGGLVSDDQMVFGEFIDLPSVYAIRRMKRAVSA